MHVDIELINPFLTGTISVLVMVLIGGFLAYLFRSISSRFTFTRTALVIALPPFCFSLCLDRAGLSTLYLFGILIIMLGFVIDGLRHLLPAGRGGDNSVARPSHDNDPDEGEKRVIWEKVD